jgi:UPF0755 protein
MKRLVAALAVLFFLLAATAAGTALFIINGLQPPQASPEKVQFTIEQGMSSGEIARLLEDKGLLRNAAVFTYYLLYKNEGHRFQAGTYEMNPGLKPDEIIAKLNAGEVVAEETIRFTIPEGYTVMQIADKLAQEGIVDKAKFLALTARPELFQASSLRHIPEDAPLKNKLEGYLFPETYELKKGSTEEDIIRRMSAELDEKLAELPDGWERRLEKLGLSIHQLLTIASLIEREVVVDKERPIVAGVIYNRLAKNMPLQIDATVQYALEEHKERLYYKDYYETDSPYNTYKIIGLPPGPIASPGLESIRAALYPEKTSYFYYVTKKDGSNEHLFAETLSEHEANIAKSMELSRKQELKW